jgi:propionyl-CoA synthetase
MSGDSTNKGAWRAAHERSLADPEGFWGEAAAAIDWNRTWGRVLDDSNAPFNRWFSGAELNTCYNAVDRHVANGRGEQAAIIHDSPVTGTVETITYAQLRDRVARVAGVLRDHRAGQGDRVIV